MYSFGVGGLERVIANLVSNSNREEVEHIIVTEIDDHSFAHQVPPETRFYCIDKKQGLDFGAHRRLYRLLKTINPDVLHTYNFGVLEYQITAALAGVRVRIHADHGRQSSYQKIENPYKYELFRRFVARFLTYYVVVSQDLYDWARERLKLSSPKLNLVFNGIDLVQFRPLAPRQPLQAAEEISFVTIGRLVDVKNHRLLINAFALAQTQSEEFARKARLRIVGDGPLMNELQALVNDLNLAQVELLGARTDIPSILHRSDVFVLSSKYEAQPMTLLEAMASELPVICTNVGGISSVINGQRNGLLVESENSEMLAGALLKALTEPDTMYAMAKQGAADVAEKFSVQAMSERYNALYGI